MTPQSLIVINAVPQEQLRRQRVLVRIDAQDEVKLSDALSTLDKWKGETGLRAIGHFLIVRVQHEGVLSREAA